MILLERIRKLYKKKVLQSAAGKAEEDRSRLGLYTAKEWEEKLETEGMAEIYQLARYSGREMTGWHPDLSMGKRLAHTIHPPWN